MKTNSSNLHETAILVLRPEKVSLRTYGLQRLNLGSAFCVRFHFHEMLGFLDPSLRSHDVFFSSVFDQLILIV